MEKLPPRGRESPLRVSGRDSCRRWCSRAFLWPGLLWGAWGSGVRPVAREQRDLGVHLLFTAVSLPQTCSNPLPYEAGQTPPKHPAVLLGRHERGSPTPSIFPALRCVGTNVPKASTWPVNKKGREHLTVVWLSPWRVCMRWPSGVGDGLIWSQEIAAGLVLQMFWSFSLIFLGSVQALRPCVQDVLGCGFLFWEVLTWLPSCINSNDKIRWLWPGIMTYMCLR